jgi:catechol 2,3-dioxygenase-like lactoylglutathione lyase family enzyme
MNDARGLLTYIAPVFRVADLKRSLAFYCDQLGFGLDFCYEEFYASVSRDGCHVHLKCADSAPRDQAAFERDESIDACVIVQNAEGLSAAFQSASVTFALPLRQMPYGVEFYVRDPDGYVLGFVQPASDEDH